MGIESGRLQFSWISSAEAGKFVDMAKEVTEHVRNLGPATKLIKDLPIIPDDSVLSMQQTLSRRE